MGCWPSVSRTEGGVHPGGPPLRDAMVELYFTNYGSAVHTVVLLEACCLWSYRWDRFQNLLKLIVRVRYS